MRPWTEIHFTVIQYDRNCISYLFPLQPVKGHLLTPACHPVQAEERRQFWEGGGSVFGARKNNKPQELKKEKEEAPYNSGDL